MFLLAGNIERVQEIIDRKKNSNKRVRLDDITTMDFVNESKHNDLLKRFEYTILIRLYRCREATSNVAYGFHTGKVRS